MLSKIFVSEIEISKVRPGQEVLVNVDAFPDKVYKGTVSTVANIGEKLPNTDSKVFEVMIRLEGSDPALRPSMTTGNRIIVKRLTDVLYIPIETVHAEADSVPFVYKKNKTRQVVVPGDSNDKEIVIEQGLEAGDQIYIIQPENPDEFRFVGKDLTYSN
jgi:multidrug efflux pump subunit AcrA (membrane-fusion protein)